MSNHERAADEPAHILKAALDSIENFAYVFDREGRFVYSNPHLLRLLGISLEEIVGKNFYDLGYPTNLATRLQSQIQKVFETGQIVRGETPFTDARGAEGFYEYIFTPFLDDKGKVEGVSGSARDVTLQRQAEDKRLKLLEQAKAERAKLHYLFERAPAFVVTMSGPQHIFELINPAYSQLIGHRDAIGKTVDDALPEIAGQGFLELLDQVYRTGKTFTSRESAIQLQRDPGAPLEERFVDFVYQPIFDDAGKVTGIFVHGIDITEQVRARKAAESANVAKDEFLATLSHELRTPLSSIIGWSSLLQGGKISAEETLLGLKTIERNALAQCQLIEDILDVSRMITGKMRLDMQPISLQNIIEKALNAISPAAQIKNVQFQPTYAQDTGAVLGDPTRLEQVIWNLLSNALKFTPIGGRVHVTLRRVESRAEMHAEPYHVEPYVEIVIADSGIGMTPEILPHIFDRFRQADSSSTRSQGGLGLGLAIVQHLVELHGGSISAQSDGLDQGAIFIVKLPLLP